MVSQKGETGVPGMWELTVRVLKELLLFKSMIVIVVVRRVFGKGHCCLLVRATFKRLL